MLMDMLLPKWFKEMLTDRSMKQARAIKNPITFSIYPLQKAI